MNYLIYPMKKVAITQTYNGGTSHKPHTTGSPKDYPIDDNCGDSKKSGYFCCPCDEIVVKRVYGVGNSGTNTVFLRSTSPVTFANGQKDHVCILVTHPDDDTLKNIKAGQKFKRKDQMFLEGKDGNASGYHFHISVGKGDFTGTGWMKNSNGKWVISCTNGPLKPEDAFFIDDSFTARTSMGGLVFKSLPKDTPVNKVEAAKSKDLSLSKTYVTTDNLRLRTGAGTTKSAIVTIPKGTKVKCYGYYTFAENVKWLYVQTTVGGKEYTGFCSKQYLK